MRKPDEIMAEHLLKGEKMLSKSCQSCYSPLFEYKGETFCAVCREREEDERNVLDSLNSSDQKPDPGKTDLSSFQPRSDPPDSSLEPEFIQTIQYLLSQIRSEHDTYRIVQLMEAVKCGSQAYALIRYGYDRRDRS